MWAAADTVTISDASAVRPRRDLCTAGPHADLIAAFQRAGLGPSVRADRVTVWVDPLVSAECSRCGASFANSCTCTRDRTELRSFITVTLAQ